MAIEYLTINGEYENLIVIERSKFICYIKGVENEEDAKEFVAKIKKQNSLATHNCYAYIADEKGLIQKFSDDGEPQGTAGLPMLETLKSKKLFKVATVVTRYFGGIKLGTGGLARAYSGSVASAIEKAEVVKLVKAKFINLYFDYEGYSKFLKVVKGDFIVSDTIFDMGVTVKITIKEELAEDFISKLIETFNGKVNYEFMGEDFYPFKVV